MTTAAIVWLVIGLVTAAAAIAVLIALVRHLFVLGRALSRFQEEVGPVAAEIGAETERASTRSRRMSERNEVPAGDRMRPPRRPWLERGS